ncbi:hypothetical protein HK097_006334, partial [Rhizophlyctis rosea]
MIRVWNDYIRLRRDWFKTKEYQSAHHNRTLLLTNVPEDMRSKERIERFMKGMRLKEPMRQVVLGRDLGELPKMVEKHKRSVAGLERVFLTYLRNPNKLPKNRPTHSEGAVMGCCGGTRVDSISTHTSHIHTLERQIYALRSKGDDHFPANASAFVSFPSIKAAHAAARKLANPLKGSSDGVLERPDA